MNRFWEKVNKMESCWLWTAGCDSDGYGSFHLNGKDEKAHRMSWFLMYGEWPDLLVLHTCDTPACVNPEHLFLGDNKANVDDALDKGRWPEGENHVRCKVPEAVLTDIRFKVALGLTCAYVGKQYGLGPSQVHRICTYQSRKRR